MNRVATAKIDPELARSHWAMSRVESERAFRAARRHSRLVRWLRLTIPIAIVANAARVAGTGIAAAWIGEEAAEGFFHVFSGWIVFVVAFVLLMALQRGLARVHPTLPRLRARAAEAS